MLESMKKGHKSLLVSNYVIQNMKLIYQMIMGFKVFRLGFRVFIWLRVFHLGFRMRVFHLGLRVFHLGLAFFI